ncbi:spermidine synthase [Paraliomyxa miuraensis]|uniref:spermidine synthase n=1 Tax=Paraliomyxa miuraensis TaxID=376150 RepID=UPI0022569170|nr:spermidine synthase [Paraliomyxa miuraensis]MCX4243581.1 spermidine synthase [Paraliomyxa miuraensis]
MDAALDPAPAATEVRAAQGRLLLLSVMVVATCGLVYELISATMASYLLGDSVTQWSLVIGVYLSAMGLGSWLSKFVTSRLHARFIHVQLIIALVGGYSATALFFGFAQLSSVRPLLFGILGLVGTMVGLEIPLLMRIMKQGQDLKDLVARVLAFDYLGSLAASVMFPLLLLPYLGLVRTSLLFGLMNAAVALWAVHAFASELSAPRWLRAQALLVLALLSVGMWGGKRLEDLGESAMYEMPVIFSQKTPYQRLTITRWQDDIRLYIDGNLQFASLDEHRYHEALVHPAMAASAASRPVVGVAAGVAVGPGIEGEGPGRRVLVLGGGDGLAVRELLAHDDVASVDLVDLDPVMTELFSTHPMLVDLNRASLSDPRVRVHNRDAMEWLVEHERASEPPFDVVVVDLPDPNNFSLGKLYSESFYRLLLRRLRPDGVGVVQATSPYLAPRSFWCIVATLRAAELHPLPYHAHVPSFGDWGFVLISPLPREAPQALRPGVEMRFLDDATLRTLFVFPADQQPPEVEVNRLNDQMLVHYYEADLVDPLGRRG